ncbi:MAG: ABC transporter ATP-binding protein [Curvibacter sp.]|nr:ABC transporter ATP-binding protein [Curvibacter sp.]
MSFLELREVRKSYAHHPVVHGIDLQVEKGEFVSLLGPSGCGKTTTLQMIAGIEPVTQGRILLDGRDITDTKPHTRGLGIVFQTYALFPHMTVADNVAFGLEMRHRPKAERQDRVRAALALVKLDQQGQRYPRELSGGQRQRVALARALVIEPPVLLLDEPLSNLDAKLREEMQFELRRIQRRVGTTTVMVTHDQSEALSVSDRVVVMQAGRITQVDTPARLYEHPGNRFISTFVGKANLLPGQWVDGERGPGVQIGDLHLAAPDLAAPAGSPVLVALRPEKLRLQPAGQGLLQGRVLECFFLGSQWLYRLQTPVGELLLVTPNDGRPALAVGDDSGLDWPAHSVRLLPADAAEALA